MNNSSVNLDPRQLLTAISLNLDSQFYAASRDHSKRLYSDIAGGQAMPFLQLNTKRSGDINCHLQLDSTQYTGKLSYSKFRKAMAVMLLGIKTRIEEEQSLNMLTSEQGDIMFNIPGIIQNKDGTNVMVCGLRQVQPGLMTVRLMFLDPERYKAEAKKVAVKVDAK